MYGMKKTTVYLPDELKRDLAKAAAASRVSEAELIRQGIERIVALRIPRRPRIPLFRTGRPDLAERVDELLDGFGED
jgi:hypothetical protein